MQLRSIQLVVALLCFGSFTVGWNCFKVVDISVEKIVNILIV